MPAADALGMATCPITLHSDEDAARVLAFLRAGVAATPSRSDTRAPPPNLPGSEAANPLRRSPPTSFGR